MYSNVTAATIDAADNEKAYSELLQLLDEKSLSMTMNDATDNGREEPEHDHERCYR